MPRMASAHESLNQARCGRHHDDCESRPLQNKRGGDNHRRELHREWIVRRQTTPCQTSESLMHLVIVTVATEASIAAGRHATPETSQPLALPPESRENEQRANSRTLVWGGRT